MPSPESDPATGLPVPRMSATIVHDLGGGIGRVVITHQDPNAPKLKEPRRPVHCTSCGMPGHNARSPKCPAKVATGSG